MTIVGSERNAAVTRKNCFAIFPGWRMKSKIEIFQKKKEKEKIIGLLPMIKKTECVV
jgi:hypothetical protein